MRKLISVTEEDILEGEREEPEYCPVALALYRESKASKTIRVYGNTFWIGKDVYEAPRSVNRFVKHFDRTGSGKPFRFFIKEPIR